MTELIAKSGRHPQPGAVEPLTEQERAEIEREASHYPNRQAATIEALKIVQKYQRWVSDGKVKAIAELLEVSPDAVDAVATFYNRIYRRPVGDRVLALCDSVSCWLLGAERLMTHACQRLRIQPGQTTTDGRFTLLPTPCLGACDKAPVMKLEDQLLTHLNPEAMDRILEGGRE